MGEATPCPAPHITVPYILLRHSKLNPDNLQKNMQHLNSSLE